MPILQIYSLIRKTSHKHPLLGGCRQHNWPPDKSFGQMQLPVGIDVVQKIATGLYCIAHFKIELEEEKGAD